MSSFDDGELLKGFVTWNKFCHNEFPFHISNRWSVIISEQGVISLSRNFYLQPDNNNETDIKLKESQRALQTMKH